MDEQQILLASQLEKKHQELEQNLQLVETQISELQQFEDSLRFLIKSKEFSTLSALGKGVYIKTSLENKEKLFVEVGSNIVVKKTPQETIKTVENQIKRLIEARIQITAQLEIYHNHLNDLVSKIEKV